jgi:hypothetical protein
VRNQHWSTNPASIQLPGLARLPAPARAPAQEFLALRARVADADRAVKDATRAKAAAEQADKAGLDSHVRGGGRAATYQPTAPAAAKAVEHARAELAVLRGLLAEQTAALGLVLTEHAPAGRQLAEHEIDATEAAYRQAIDTVQAARSDYYRACALADFWRRVAVHKTAAYVESDTLHTARSQVANGHIGSRYAGVDVDTAVFNGLRDDARAHERMRVAERHEAGEQLGRQELASLGFAVNVAGQDGRIST